MSSRRLILVFSNIWGNCDQVPLFQGPGSDPLPVFLLRRLYVGPLWMFQKEDCDNGHIITINK